MSLFIEVLEIPDVGLDDLLEELLEFRSFPPDFELEFRSLPPDFDEIYKIYRILHDMIPQMTETEKKFVRSVSLSSVPFLFFAYSSRQYFEEKELVYHLEVNEADPRCWYLPDECLWSTTTEIKGKRNISNLYEGLFAFFVDVLGVPTLTLKMVVDKFAELGKDQGTSIEEAKDIIWQVNALLQGEEDHPDSSRIVTENVFPIRNPNNGVLVELRSSKTDFIIPDREPLLNLFSDRARILDFSVNEIHRLEPFLRWTGLEYRYLSRSVKEITALGNDDSSKRLTSTDRDIALKAHGLLR